MNGKSFEDILVPENLCVVPFIHMGTKPDGVARVCCMAPDLEIQNQEQRVYSFPKTEIREAWNSSYMRQLRKKMLDNEKLPECSACWKQEEAGPHSKRLRENRKYLAQNIERIDEASRYGGEVKESPIYFDLRLGNKCNLRCRTCNPIFSQSIMHELTKKPQTSFLPETQQHIDSMMNRAVNIGKWHSKDFFSDLMKMGAGLEEIYISGGEPLIISELEQFLKEYTGAGMAVNTDLRLNSNITVLRKDFFESFKKFKKVLFGASIDAFGVKNNWMRHPSKWEVIVENLKTLNEFREKNQNFRLSVNITVSIYNVLYLDELILWLKKEFPRVSFSLDFVSEPAYMSLNFLSKRVVDQALLKIERIDVGSLTKHELMYIDQFKNYIKPSRSENSKELLSQFYNHTKVVDQWRFQKAQDIFTELFHGLEAHKEARAVEH